uniref:DUF4368 domain-containing protein n=2 Tax=Caenorhabditis tropicalis TaxID=1561998 RepID=A0A1I7UR24_9PELO
MAKTRWNLKRDIELTDREMDKELDSSYYRFSQEIKQLLAEYDTLTHQEASRRYQNLIHNYKIDLLVATDKPEPIDVIVTCFVLPVRIIRDFINYAFGYRPVRPSIVYHV